MQSLSITKRKTDTYVIHSQPHASQSILPTQSVELMVAHMDGIDATRTLYGIVALGISGCK